MLTRREREVVHGCTTPLAVQRYLNSLPYNHERRGETLRSFRGALRAGKVHCLEAALTAAAILEHHGYPPLLVDLCSVDKLDHVLFVFRHRGLWGSVARSRDPGLHGRRPVFRSLRALVRSYVLPYIDMTGRIEGYGVLDLRALPARVDWRFSARNVWAVEEALNDNEHTVLRTSEREYARWLRRYEAFKQRFPRDKPIYYPKRHQWLR